MSMTSKQVRVVDPVLTTVARGYQDPQFVGNELFPQVPVSASGGQILEFNKESWRKFNIRRAPGGNVAEIDFGYLGKPYALVQDSLHAKVPREHLRDAETSPGIDLGTIAVNTGMSVIRRHQEIDQAIVATTAANYETSNKVDLTASSWNDPDRDPVADIKLGKQTISDRTGHEPNKLVCSSDAWYALINNPHVIGLFTRGEIENLVITPAMLAAKLDLEKISVGRVTYTNDQGVNTKAWGTHAVLAYTNIGTMSNALPSFGYTYQMAGNPVVEQNWYNNTNKSWMYPVNNEYSAVIAGADAGYLFIAAGATFSG